MIILYVITKSELGGAQSVLVNIANSLCRNNKIIVVAGEGDGKIWGMLKDNIIKIKCPYLKRSISPKNDIKASFFLRNVYIKYNPDVIHLHSSKAGFIGRLVMPKNKIIYTVHGFDSVRRAHRSMLIVEKIFQHKCKTIAGVSKYDVRNLWSEGIKKAILVYNGVPNTIVKHKNSLPKDTYNYKNKVLCIARDAKPKRLDIFIDVAQKCPNTAFIWIGNQNKLEKHPNNVFFLGNITNASEYCNLVDLFMLASDYEGLPMVILEAMSYGKPIVASNVGGISEIVINNYNGFTVKNNPKEFVEKINYILNSQTIKEDFSSNSEALYKKEFTVEKMVNSYTQLYYQIYKGNHKL